MNDSVDYKEVQDDNKNDEEDDDYEDDEDEFDMEEKGSQGVGITQKQKMSLESDQDAPENEFE